MDWKKKNVLITGGGGFVGSHLVERLAGTGARVTALVRYNSRNDPGMLKRLPPPVKKKIEIVAGDLRDPETVRAAARDAEVIFHLGALIAIPYSYLHPREVVETNVLGTLNVLQSARELSVERVIHTSTSEVYGSARYTPMDENHPLQGQSPYSASKIAADKIAESFYRSFDLPVCVIRPFNAFGPRQSDRAVIPTIISQCLAGRELSLGSLDTTRDYTFVDDLTVAFIRMAEVPEAVGEVVNVGSNFEISIGEIARRVMKILGKDIRVVSDPRRLRPGKSEVARLWCDNRKARQLLDWEPKISFDRGLEKTIRWIEKNPAFYHPEQFVV